MRVCSVSAAHSEDISLQEHVCVTVRLSLNTRVHAGAALCTCVMCSDTKMAAGRCSVTTLDQAGLHKCSDEMLFILFSSVESC